MNDLAYAQETQPAIPSILDRIEAWLYVQGSKRRAFGGEMKEAPLKHVFTPGLYTRTIFMPANLFVTSMIHRTEHPFMVSKGVCLVYIEGKNEWKKISAPYLGITKAGTRRLLMILEDTIWSTFHPTNLTDVEAIEREIALDYQNPLLPPIEED